MEIINAGCIKLLKFCVLIYRYCFSFIFGNCCRFYPSCSAYALEALDAYRLIHALKLITMRILRCHPKCKGGFDPLPFNKQERNL